MKNGYNLATWCLAYVFGKYQTFLEVVVML